MYGLMQFMCLEGLGEEPFISLVGDDDLTFFEGLALLERDLDFLVGLILILCHYAFISWLFGL